MFAWLITGEEGKGEMMICVSNEERKEKISTRRVARGGAADK